MAKTLTDQELKEKYRTLDRGQLENSLIQLVRQLEEYEDKELTEEDKISLEKIKTEKAILERRFSELEKDAFLAAELGITLLKTKVDLEVKLAILEGQLEGKISREKTEELEKNLVNYEERQQEWNEKEQKLKVEIRKIKQENNKIKKKNDNLIEEAKNIDYKMKN